MKADMISQMEGYAFCNRCGILGWRYFEPVSLRQRFIVVFWGLDSAGLQTAFPAINWLNSYSLYLDDMETWFNANVASDWMEGRQKMMTLLGRAELEIVKW